MRTGTKNAINTMPSMIRLRFGSQTLAVHLIGRQPISYDPAGHVLSITQTGDGSSAARQRTFQYSSLGKLVLETTPESGAKSYAYDANGNLTSEATPRGTISYQYDALNCMTQKSSSDFTYSYIYDTSSPGGGFTSANSIGRLVEASSSANANSYYSYDAMGRVIYQGNCIPTREPLRRCVIL